MRHYRILKWRTHASCDLVSGLTVKLNIWVKLEEKLDLSYRGAQAPCLPPFMAKPELLLWEETWFLTSKGYRLLCLGI